MLSSSAYTEYVNKPHVWVRWRIEETLRGIALAGKEIGPDYRNGQKSVMADLELFHARKRAEAGCRPPTPQGAYHDFWQAVVSGAHGIMVYSHFHTRDHPQLPQVLDAYCRAAGQLSGGERLGRVALWGKCVEGFSLSVRHGPAMAEPFHATPYSKEKGLPETVLPAVNGLAKSWNGKLYVILVNSAAEDLTVKATGLPAAAADMLELFAEGPPLTLGAGSLECRLAPLGVRFFRFDLPDDAPRRPLTR